MFSPFPKRNKYGAKKAGGFDSKLEQNVHAMLLEREARGEIKDIQRQQPVVLIPGDRKQKITWRIDFSFIHVASGELVYCEAKGFPTEVYKLKLKLYRYLIPNRLEIWKGNKNGVYLDEEINANLNK